MPHPALLSCIAAALIAANLVDLVDAGEPRDLPEATLQQLIQQLDASDFATRSAAEQALAGAGAGNIEALEAAAARSDGEHATRIVAVLERLYVGRAILANTREWGRAAALSSGDVLLTLLRVGDYDVSETVHLAESALERLSRLNTPVAGYADSALNRHGLLRENRAIQKLRSLGAKVVFASEPDFGLGWETLRELPPEGANAVPVAPALHRVAQVYLLNRWQGGTAGLNLLNRLRVQRLHVYLITGCGITEPDLFQHAGDVETLDIEHRSDATLGVVSVNPMRCEVGGLPEGLAAHRAGVRVGDEILAVEGLRVGDFKSLVETLKRYESREVIELLVIRRSQPFTEREIPGLLMDGDRLPGRGLEAGNQLLPIEVTLSDWSEVPDFIRAR